MRSDKELLQDALFLIESGTKGGEAYDITEEIRAAVERAEKQENMGFEVWWKDHGNGGYHDSLAAWTAAQQAERERCREIVITISGCASWGGPDVPDLLRQIDSGED